MKKTLLLVLVLLPFWGIAQTVDLASWALTSNGNATTKQSYVQSAVFSSNQNKNVYGSTGALVSGWDNNGFEHYRFVEISITPTAGNVIWVSNLVFQQASIPNGSTPGPSTYIAKYYVADNGNIPSTFDFYNNSSSLVSEESISGNPSKNIKINQSVNANQKLIVRLYTKGTDYNNISWQFLANTLKFTGKLMLPLAGTYTIGSVSTADFSTLTSAVNALNNVGVSAAVTFLLDNTNYNRTTNEVFPLVINPYLNNTNFKVTFKPNTNRTVTIEATNSPPETSTPAVFKLNGVDNVVFDGSNNGTTSKNLTIYNNNPINPKKSVIWIASENSSNGASNNEIKNLFLRQYYRDDNISVGVFGGGTSSVGSDAEAANSNNLVQNVTFTKVGQAVYAAGTASALSSDWKIQNNTIGGTTTADKPFLGIYLSNMKDYEISGNTISGIEKNTTGYNPLHSGIIITGNSNGIISRNTITNVNNSIGNSYCAGIYIDSPNNSIYNNFISNIVSSNTGHGIYLNSGNSNTIYYNTIVMNNNSNPAGSSCLYIPNAVTGIGIKNNIFYSSQTTGTQYLINANVAHSAITEFDYNDYFLKSTGALSNRLSTGTYTTLTGWKGVSSSKEQNSINVEPQFISTTDFHLAQNTTNSGIHAKGTPISTITADIDSETRNTTAPDMGADEIIICEQGDQNSFGNNSWIGYVYKWSGTVPNPALNASPATATNVFIGNVTEPAIFDRNIAAGTVRGVTTNICGPAPADNFFVRYKMQTTTTAGTYNFTIGGDDGVRLYIDGTLVNVAPTNSYTGHSYTTYAAKVDLTAGPHTFVLEYFENGQDSRVSFSYGEIKGDISLPYGINKWNVYGFSVADITLPAYAYAGMYVDNNLNVNTQTSWNKNSSPSTASGWQGAPIGNDQFTITYKREGFPCGSYQIQLLNCDDVGEIYLNGTSIFLQDGYTNATKNVGTYTLNSASKIEVRLRENGSDANIAVSFTTVPNNYDGTSTPAPGTAITVASNTTLASDLNVCSCTVKTGVTFTIPNNRTLTVDDALIFEGTGKLLINDGGSLLQNNTTANAFQGGSTNFEMQRKTVVRRYDYTYWSSPLTLASGFTLYKMSPNTLSDKYTSYNPNASWVISYGGVLPMTPGEGYSVRGPQNFDIVTPSTQTASFIGIPNNGDVPKTTVPNKFNLLGNPYPSAIDGNKLIRDTNIGTIYLWTHNTPPANDGSSNKYKYASADYAAFNLSGSVRNGGDSTGPTGYIAAGQGFFAKPTTSSITYTNSMRVSANNGNFYKTAKTENLERNRVWLNLSNAEGAFKQTLVGYIEGATNGLDLNYDAASFNGNTYVDFYSINETAKFSIQGRALPFENSDVIPLGYKTTVAGDFTISIDHVDGFFDNQNVYLEDKTTGVISDLKAQDYTFKTEAGSFTDRFALRYTNKTLGTDDFENINEGLFVSIKDKVIKVASAKENIKEIHIFDITGKSIYQKGKVGTAEYSISNLQSSDQVLLVKIILENDYTTTKKVIFK